MTESDRKKTIAVVVLGDLDRSPRMLNHAVSAAQNGLDVTLVGYQGSSLPAQIINQNQDVKKAETNDSDNQLIVEEESPTKMRGTIKVSALSTKIVDIIRHLPRVLYLVYAVIRIIVQSCQLLY